MIQALGASPISGVTKAGMSEFLSLLRPKPSKAFGDDPSRYFRPYTNTRGVIINKDFLRGSTPDLTKGYQFQFNPATINDVKEALYESRTYIGLPYQDYIWKGGGQRTITLQLFLDDTPQSHIRSFRPTAIGGKDASTLKVDSKFTYDETGRLTGTGTESSKFGQAILDEAISQGKALYKGATAPFMKASSKPNKFEWDENGAYSHSRTRKRGVLDDVELIQSFLYPAPLVGENTPKFAEGGIVSLNQFRPPATAVLCIGPIYLEGIVKAAPVQYTLFDQDLCPIRATIDLEFSVFEFEEVTRKIKWNQK